MSRKSSARPWGQVRQSQMVTTFGPGSLVDLPERSVIIGGLEQWLQRGDEIHEPRLVEKLKKHLSLKQLSLYGPPPTSDDPSAPRRGVMAYLFPEWFLTQEVSQGASKGSRSRRLVHRRRLERYRFVDEGKRKLTVVPVRFVQACPRGHISDVDWYSFAHKGSSDCRRPLWMDERGTSGDLAEVVVRCECGQERALSEAYTGVLGECFGRRPWLGVGAEQPDCGLPNRLLIRHASNAYFPQVMSVISLPDRNEKLTKAVDHFWETCLQYAEDADDVARDRTKRPPVRQALEGFTDAEVLEEIRIRKGLDGDRPVKKVKAAEFELLSGAIKESLGDDAPDSDFFARRLSFTPSQTAAKSIERVVLVHKLREVVAQLGFTRFEAASPDIDGELQMGVQAADIAREPTWFPAIENRGEGLFIQFRKDLIDEWRSRPAVLHREQQLRSGFDRWKAEHPQSERRFPYAGYLLMHSLSHVLLTAISLECGYPASSIRERVYAGEAGYGILLYTGTPDAEGTLGGLIEAGKRIERHLENALELARLCSNDPVCSQHDPAHSLESRHLHGAACHGCLLIAETSCEQHNDFLDRALLVPTVDSIDAAFFDGVRA